MNRIKEAFQHGKAFIPFITCGDPDLETTEKIVYEMVENGADLIEFGIPFSDPTAEGPTIQEANIRALRNEITTDSIFDFVKKVNQNINIPTVFMTYSNVVFSYGAERFISTCSKIGICGLILPDLPFEEKEEFEPLCIKHNIALIPLIAPTSKERVSMIASKAKGFVYAVSSLGVTGVRSEITTDIGAVTKLIKENTKIPVAIGFGVSTPEQAREMSQLADGVIVGSAIIKIIQAYGKDSPKRVGEYVKSMKNAMKISK